MLRRFTRKSNVILLGIIMIVGFALRFATLQTHGADLTLASDDLGIKNGNYFIGNRNVNIS